MSIVLTRAQENAVSLAIQAFERGDPLFRIGGYAGTGKTTIAKEIVKRIKGSVAVCAFTGKAANVLHHKGLPGARTIHRTIYDYDERTESFVRKPALHAKAILIDEGSMVSDTLWEDLQRFGLPIIVIGDPGQLEPVGNDPRLMHDPDIVLEEIHRQAAESQIITLANHVRKGGHVPKGEWRDVQVLPKFRANDDLLWADQVLCGYNVTRVQVNDFIRHELGLSGDGVVAEGERIICLQNNLDLGVFNGQMFTVDSIKEEGEYRIKARVTGDDGVSRKMDLWPGHFGQEKKIGYDVLRKVRDRVIADYAYGITVHKSQGSEFFKVIVIDEQCSVWDSVRWRYTAITRAASELRYYV